MMLVSLTRYTTARKLSVQDVALLDSCSSSAHTSPGRNVCGPNTGEACNAVEYCSSTSNLPPSPVRELATNRPNKARPWRARTRGGHFDSNRAFCSRSSFRSCSNKICCRSIHACNSLAVGGGGIADVVVITCPKCVCCRLCGGCVRHHPTRKEAGCHSSEAGKAGPKKFACVRLVEFTRTMKDNIGV